MALSNKWNALVLTTGNKSENGRRLLHALRRHVRRPGRHQRRAQNHGLRFVRVVERPPGSIVPENVFLKPPSAELRPDQKDTDSLPAYEVLDAFSRTTSRT